MEADGEMFSAEIVEDRRLDWWGMSACDWWFSRSRVRTPYFLGVWMIFTPESIAGGGEASDSGLLGAVYVAAIDDATVHQDAVDASDANNVFTLFVTFVARSNV